MFAILCDRMEIFVSIDQPIKNEVKGHKRLSARVSPKPIVKYIPQTSRKPLRQKIIIVAIQIINSMRISPEGLIRGDINDPSLMVDLDIDSRSRGE